MQIISTDKTVRSETVQDFTQLTESINRSQKRRTTIFYDASP